MAPGSVTGGLVLSLAGGLIIMACSSSSPIPIVTTPTPVSSAPPVQPLTPSPTPSSEETDTPVPTPTTELAALFDYTRAVQLLEIEEWDKAIGAFGLVIRRLPDFAKAYHGRALAFYGDKRSERALEDLDMAIELEPDLAGSYKDRAVIYRDQGKTEAAIADLERAVSLYDPVREARGLLEARQLLGQLR